MALKKYTALELMSGKNQIACDNCSKLHKENGYFKTIKIKISLYIYNNTTY